jgi:hypothetical protein
VHPGEATVDALGEWGFSADDVAKLIDAGAVV